MSYKHSAQETSITVTATQDEACPVASLRDYLSQRGKTPGPLFSKSGRPIPRQALLKILHQCINFLSMPTEYYNLHSFRIGRTTDLAQANNPYSTIQKIGRWKSNAFMKYIRPNEITTIPQLST
jgi:hypothetical protein